MRQYRSSGVASIKIGVASPSAVNRPAASRIRPSPPSGNTIRFCAGKRRKRSFCLSRNAVAESGSETAARGTRSLTPVLQFPPRPSPLCARQSIAHRPRRPGANRRGTRPSRRAEASPLCAHQSKAHRPRRPGANGRRTRPSRRAEASPLCARQSIAPWNPIVPSPAFRNLR